MLSDPRYQLPAGQDKFLFSYFNDDEEIEIGRYLNDRFPDAEAFELDMGAGKGDFLINFCKNNPKRVMIGLEKKWERCKILTRKIFRQNIDNAFIVQGLIEEILERGFGKIRFAQIYMNYPDPWPKKRHHKRRTIRQNNFITHLAKNLMPGGLFTFVSDQRDYTEEAWEELNKCGLFENVFPEKIVHEIDGYHSTLFERYAIKDGLKPNYIRFRLQHP